MKPSTRYLIIFLFVLTGWYVTPRRSTVALNADATGGGKVPIATAMRYDLEPYRLCHRNTSEIFLVTTPSEMKVLIWVTAERRCNRSIATALPLLVYIHGAGEVGDDPAILLDSEGGRGSIPSILCRKEDSGTGQRNDDDGAQADLGHHPLLAGTAAAVVMMPQSRRGWTDSDEELRDLQALVADLLRRGVALPLKEHCGGLQPRPIRLDPGRVIVTGVSQGGYAVLRFAVLFPELVSAAAPLCGFDGAGFKTAVGDCRRTKVMLAHGQNDAVVPVSESVRLFEECSRCNPLRIRIPVGTTFYKSAANASTLGRFVFAEFERASDPLDGNAMAAGHAVWRDVYATSSPFWRFVFSP